MSYWIDHEDLVPDQESGLEVLSLDPATATCLVDQSCPTLSEEHGQAGVPLEPRARVVPADATSVEVRARFFKDLYESFRSDRRLEQVQAALVVPLGKAVERAVGSLADDSKIALRTVSLWLPASVRGSGAPGWLARSGSMPSDPGPTFRARYPESPFEPGKTVVSITSHQ